MLRISTLLAATAATVALAAASGASAAVYTFSPFNITSSTDATVTTQANNNIAGTTAATYNDAFNFFVSGSDLTDFTYSITFSTKNKDSISAISIAVFEGTPTASGAAPVGAVALTPSTIYTNPGVPDTDEYTLTGGDYFLEATTTVPAGKQGLYTVTASGTPISAAPEPGTWALMFAGVGVAGAALRMSRRSGSLAAA